MSYHVEKVYFDPNAETYWSVLKSDGSWVADFENESDAHDFADLKKLESD